MCSSLALALGRGGDLSRGRGCWRRSPKDPARSVRHEGCLRYAWPLGQNARARRRVEVAMAAREFPVWDAGQLPLFM